VFSWFHHARIRAVATTCPFILVYTLDMYAPLLDRHFVHAPRSSIHISLLAPVDADGYALLYVRSVLCSFVWTQDWTPPVQEIAAVGRPFVDNTLASVARLYLLRSQSTNFATTKVFDQ
jgi:hypothetical protein